MVPARPTFRTRQCLARLLRLERNTGPLSRGADHLQGRRDLQLVLGSGGQGLLLAPLLRSPAGPQLRQPAGPGGRHPGVGLLAGAGRGRPPARRGPLPLRARRDGLREPARDPRLPAPAEAPHRRPLPGPDAAGGGEPVARGRRPLLRQRRRMPHGVPLPAHAEAVHGDPDGGPPADRGHPRPDAPDPGRLPVGALPAQPRRADPRDGDRRGARLHGTGPTRATHRRASTSGSAAASRRCSATTGAGSS